MLYMFDLDGTLVDSLADLRKATEYALVQLGYPGHPLKSYRYFVGNGVKQLILRALGTTDEIIYQKARTLFDEYYWQHCLDETRPYHGIKELLQFLKADGHIIGVITNKPNALANKICQCCFSGLTDFCQGQEEGVAVKPNPYFVNYYMEYYHLTVDQCVFIGDSNVDIETGKNAGIATVGVTWGNRPYEELSKAGADQIVSDVVSLKKMLWEMAQ